MSSDGEAAAAAAAAGGIQGLLLKLHDSLSDEDTRAAALKCHDIVSDLGQECMLTPTENELGKTMKTLLTGLHSVCAKLHS